VYNIVFHFFFNLRDEDRKNTTNLSHFLKVKNELRLTTCLHAQFIIYFIFFNLYVYGLKSFSLNEEHIYKYFFVTVKGFEGYILGL
jgi:hypothetical protein